MKKRLRLVSLLISFILAVSLFSGCSKKQESGLIKVNFNEVVRSIFYAPMYVALQEGFFKDAGLDINLTTGQGADSPNAKTQVQFILTYSFILVLGKVGQIFR